MNGIRSKQALTPLSRLLNRAGFADFSRSSGGGEFADQEDWSDSRRGSRYRSGTSFPGEPAMWRRVWFSAFLPAICFTVGCQSSPRYVSQGQDEGIIAMPDDTPANRRAAERLMAAHFPGGYDVVYEYEEKIGESSRRVSNPQGGPPTAIQPVGGYQPGQLNPGIRRPRTRLETVDKTEWRIRYRRKGAPATAPAGGTSIANVLPQK
jgi:hypothetical protein